MENDPDFGWDDDKIPHESDVIEPGSERSIAAERSARQSMYGTPEDPMDVEPPIANRNGDTMYGGQVGVEDYRAMRDADPAMSRLPVLLDFEGIHLAGVLDELSADPTRRTLTEAAIRDKAILAVNTRAAARTAAREQNATGGVVTSELDIRDEALGASGDADVLRAFGRAFNEAAKQGDVLTAELVGLLPPRPSGPRRSFTVADGHGFDLKATSSPNTKPFAELPEIIDVIVATLIARDTKADGGESIKNPDGIRRYGEGLRDGIASILEVLAAPSVKTTALDALGKRLQAMGEIELARRLAVSYGRKEVGEPTVKIERTVSKVK